MKEEQLSKIQDSSQGDDPNTRLIKDKHSVVGRSFS